MDKLQVSFNSPQCGWMSIGFINGGQEFHTTTAHAPHEKALAELLSALSEILRKENYSHVLKWNRLPEEFDFVFEKNGADVLLEIIQYPTEKRDASEGETVFSYQGNALKIAEAFHETFVQLYEDRNTDEFEFNWRQPFPLAEYENFETALKNYEK
jgi:hypothetical protein